jgi:hypothetical protein
MFRNSFLLWLCLVIYTVNLLGQGSLPRPNLWWKTQYSATGMAKLTEHDEIVSSWNNDLSEVVNFHTVPVISSFPSEITNRSILTQGGITTFSIYRNAFLEKEQSLWSLSHGNTLIAMASDARFSNVIDNVDYTFKGISNQWLRLSTHFFSHQSLNNANCKYHFGHHPDQQINHFTGVLLEELVFDRVLSKKQRKQVESYLSVKYGLPLLSSGQLEYINSIGNTYWSASKKYAFRHRPTAIGRDDFWQLYQRQSTNAYEPGLLTIGLGQIKPKNEENNGVLKDLSFLFWSDNNAALEIKNASNLLDRRWEIQKINLEQSNTSLRLGVRQLKTELEDNEKYWLAIDRSGENVFSVQTTDYYAPLLNDDTEYIYYEAIQWDGNQYGKNHFTFRRGGDLIVVYDTVLPSCDQEESGQIVFKIYGGTSPYSYQIQSSSIGGSSWTGELTTIDGLSSGKHSLWITDANGLQVKQEIDMYNAEVHPLIADLDKVYQIKDGEKLELALPESCVDCSFEWLFPNDERKTGHRVTLSQAGSYQLEVTRGNCQNTFDFLVKKHQSPFQSVELLGNPTSGGRYILEIRLWETQPTSIFIFNQQGQLIQQVTLPLNHYHKYEGQGLAEGTYHIQVHSGGTSITKTLITL